MNIRTTTSLLAIASLGLGAAQAALTTVFEYSFRGAGDTSGSYNGSGTTVTDLSGAGNDGTIHPGTGGGIVDDRPSGFSSSVMALTGSAGGHGSTDAIDLLNNTAVGANGGFTIDIWFKYDGFGGTRKLIDYAGTESLRTNNGELQFALNNGGTIISFGQATVDQWYHVVGVFDTNGNAAVADPGFAGEFIVDGTASLHVDGVSVGTPTSMTLSSFGDRLDRGIGFNMWPNEGDYNQGMIFNPTVSLGVVPEPSSAALLGLGGLALILRRRK